MMDPRRTEFYAKHRDRMCDLIQRFVSYHTPLSQRRLKDFLNQFLPRQMELGLKVLDQVYYFSQEETTKQIKLLVSLLCDEINLKSPNVYFCTMSTSSGQSTDTVMRTVRHVTGMGSSTYDSRFLFFKDLESWQSDADQKTIIFIDDFIGSGDTVSNAWYGLCSREWYNKNHQYYVGVIVGYKSIIDRIEEETLFKIISAATLAENTRIFHNNNSVFSRSEKTALKKYCRMADERPDFQYGYKNTQSLIVFQENTPDNTIAILHHKSLNWKFPPLPRMS